MILGSYQKYNVGEVHTGEYHLTDTKIVKLTCMIMRVATRTEWEEYRKSVNRPLTITIEKWAYYYEVSTD